MQLKALYLEDRSLLNYVFLPQTFWQRARGLLAKPLLQADEGYLFTECRCIHMFGMRYALDIVFLDAQMKICKVVPDLAPWRLAYCLSAKYTLELAPGSVSRLGLILGQQLELR